MILIILAAIFVIGFIGLLTYSLMKIAGESDKRMEQMYRKELKKNREKVKNDIQT